MMVHSGFVAIIGRPNVGKSTLLNVILGEKISIATDRPQTTRNSIRGIYNEADESGDSWQIVFIDTPGITSPKNKLGEYMSRAALKTFDEVDVILFIVDAPLAENGGDNYILGRLKEVKTPKILVINKIDIMGPDDFRLAWDTYEGMGLFASITGTSAVTGKNVGNLVEALKGYMGEGVQWFPPDMVTDRPERFIAAEIIREKLLLYMRDEIPHGVAVEIESWEEKGETTKISAVIYTEKKSHKGMIIGKDGRKLKGIGMSAREDIESILGAKVYLQLWVKFKDRWRDDDYMLRSLGYEE